MYIFVTIDRCVFFILGLFIFIVSSMNTTVGLQYFCKKSPHFKGSVSANVNLYFCHVKREHILIWMNSQHTSQWFLALFARCSWVCSQFWLYAVETWTNGRWAYFRTGYRGLSDNNRPMQNLSFLVIVLFFFWIFTPIIIILVLKNCVITFSSFNPCFVVLSLIVLLRK